VGVEPYPFGVAPAPGKKKDVAPAPTAIIRLIHSIVKFQKITHFDAAPAPAPIYGSFSLRLRLHNTAENLFFEIEYRYGLKFR
jgi:hypothetical protein